jgi:hypothetical protein
MAAWTAADADETKEHALAIRVGAVSDTLPQIAYNIVLNDFSPQAPF